MFYFQSSLLVLTLQAIIGSAIGAAVPTLSNLELETIASVFDEGGYYSTDKDSDILVQCECVLLFSCKVEDVVLWPVTDDDNDQSQCPDPYICCKIQNTEPPPPTSLLPQENSTIFSLDPYEGVKEMTTNGPIIGDEIIYQMCECVLLNQCDPQNIANLSASNLSQNQCDDPSKVCCKLTNSTSSPSILYTPVHVPPPPPPPQSNGNKVIAYGLSEDEEPIELKCECVPPVFCPQSDVIELPTPRIDIDQCSTGEICCKTLNSTSPQIPQPTKQTPSNNTNQVIIYGISDDDEHKELVCECVLFYECDVVNVIQLPTAYNNKDKCVNEFKSCCRRSNSTSPSPPASPPIQPTPSNNTNRVIIYGVSFDDNELKPLECECVTFFLCQTENIIELPTTNNKEDQCLETDSICCKRSNSTSPSPPISQPTELTPPNNTNQVIIYGLVDNDELKPLECQCVNFYECIPENVIELPTVLNGEECLGAPQVCCKRSNSTSPSPPIPQPTDPTQSNNNLTIIYGMTDGDNPQPLECQCVLFYECIPENIIVLPTVLNGEECLDAPQVCCKRSNSTSPSPPIPQPTDPTQSNNNLTIIYGLTDGDNPQPLECQCVLFYECTAEDVIELPNDYSEKCLGEKVCCNRSKPKSPPILSTSEPKPYNDTNQVIIYGLCEDRELECQCEAFYLCPAKDVIELPTNYNKRDRCSTSNVCCKKTNSLVPSPPPQSLEPPRPPQSLEPPKPPQPPQPPQSDNIKKGPVTLELSFKITWWP